MLRVKQSDLRDVMGDIARFDKMHRTFDGKLVRAGRVVVLKANKKTERVVARGPAGVKADEIALTLETRQRLGISSGECACFTIAKANVFDEFLWAWTATNPTDRIAARLGVTSVILGLVGAFLGVISAAVTFPSAFCPLVILGLVIFSSLLLAIGYLWGSKS